MAAMAFCGSCSSPGGRPVSAVLCPRSECRSARSSLCCPVRPGEPFANIPRRSSARTRMTSRRAASELCGEGRPAQGWLQPVRNWLRRPRQFPCAGSRNEKGLGMRLTVPFSLRIRAREIHKLCVTAIDLEPRQLLFVEGPLRRMLARRTSN
jgi:hypothetical protein